MPQKKKVRTKKRERKLIHEGKAFITSTFNNTIITLTDRQGWRDLLGQLGHSRV